MGNMVGVGTHYPLEEPVEFPARARVLHDPLLHGQHEGNRPAALRLKAQKGASARCEQRMQASVISVRLDGICGRSDDLLCRTVLIFQSFHHFFTERLLNLVKCLCASLSISVFQDISALSSS